MAINRGDTPIYDSMIWELVRRNLEPEVTVSIIDRPQDPETVPLGVIED